MGLVVSGAVAAIPFVEQEELRRLRLQQQQQQAEAAANRKHIVSHYHPSLYSPKKRNKPEVVVLLEGDCGVLYQVQRVPPLSLQSVAAIHPKDFDLRTGPASYHPPSTSTSAAVVVAGNNHRSRSSSATKESEERTQSGQRKTVQIKEEQKYRVT